MENPIEFTAFQHELSIMINKLFKKAPLNETMGKKINIMKILIPLFNELVDTEEITEDVILNNIKTIMEEQKKNTEKYKYEAELDALVEEQIKTELFWFDAILQNNVVQIKE